MSQDHLQPYAPSLESLRQDIVDTLKLAVRNRASPMRTPVIATVDSSGNPQARVMILRGFDDATMTLRLFTDGRSPKVGQLRYSSKAQAVFYDAAIKLHIRASGSVTLHSGKGLASGLWSELPEFGRGDYLTRLPPGDEIPDPTEGWQQEAAFGSDNFTVLDINVQEMDWLKLSAGGHKRARLVWQNGHCDGRWVTP